jgi:E3 ubiquitin-protein ligase DOA10
MTSEHQTIVIQSPLSVTNPPCMFCLEQILPDDHLITKNGCQCAITFHSHCIKTWIQMYEEHECPLCRKHVTFIVLSSQPARSLPIEIVLIALGFIAIIISYYIYVK